VFDQRPLPRRDRAGLIEWVREGIDVSGSPGDTFQTDGRMYLFSTLRPSDSLRLVAMDEDWLNVIVFVFVALAGLALLRNRAEIRWLAMGAFLVFLVLAGVFFPTFSRQIIDGNLISAVFIVLVVWFVQYLAWVRPRDPGVAARKQARESVRLTRIQAKAAAKAPPPPGGEKSPPGPAERRPDKAEDEEKKGNNNRGGSNHA